ncbi:MAG TPA: glycosyltransferase family 2 protein [Phnomibacter sp.]|nr:glycosyltransferase family 2 protein [Phnomibacter sp.]
MPLITVIVPNFNHASFLARRINSILLQSFNDFEIIILDDASTDNSRDILESYRSHPKVKAIHYNRHNSGSPFKQWEKGIGLAASEWIWIAESDDYCTPYFLEALLPAMQHPKCVLAYHAITWVNEKNEIIKSPVKHRPKWFEGKAFLQKKMLVQNTLVNAGMCVFRRSALQQVAPGWQAMRQAGDYWLFTEVARQGLVFASGEPQAFFRRHNRALTVNNLSAEWAMLERLQVTDQMLQRNSIIIKHYRNLFVNELTTLHTQKRGLNANAFQEQWQWWQQQALLRDVHIPLTEIWIQSARRKAAHLWRQWTA